MISSRHLCWLLLVFLPAGTGQAAAPVSEKAATVSLGWSWSGKPIGVEPEGGRFRRILGAGAKAGDHEEVTFSTSSRQQEKGVLAIYATDSDFLREDKPLARLELVGLSPGEQKNRVRIKMTIVAPRTLAVEAWDIPNNRQLTVGQLTPNAVRRTTFAAPERKPAAGKVAGGGPPAIASREAPAATMARAGVAQGTLRENIGIRSAGGLFKPLSSEDSTPGSAKVLYLRPRYPDQSTIDVTLFTGDSPYIENNRLWARFVVSGLAPGGAARRVKLEFPVGANGKLGPPRATEVTSKQNLRVEKYSQAAVERLQEAPHDVEPTTNSLIPAAPER